MRSVDCNRTLPSSHPVPRTFLFCQPLLQKPYRSYSCRELTLPVGTVDSAPRSYGPSHNLPERLISIAWQQFRGKIPQFPIAPSHLCFAMSWHALRWQTRRRISVFPYAMNVNLMIPSRSLGRAVNQNISVNQIHHVLSTPPHSLHNSWDKPDCFLYLINNKLFPKDAFLKEKARFVFFKRQDLSTCAAWDCLPAIFLLALNKSVRL